jgi:hypothetical protein
MPPRSAAEVAFAADFPLLVEEELLLLGGEHAAAARIAATAIPIRVIRSDLLTSVAFPADVSPVPNLRVKLLLDGPLDGHIAGFSGCSGLGAGRTICGLCYSKKTCRRTSHDGGQVGVSRSAGGFVEGTCAAGNSRPGRVCATR